MEINFDKNKIKKIEYELNERKTATFIFKNGNLADVNVKELSMEEPDYQPFSVMENYKLTCLDDNTKTTLESSRKKEWIDSVRENEIKVSNFEHVNLDEKYKGLTHEEKMQVSKQIIDNDAKEDTELIKNKVESSIGDNKPLSEEVSKYPKRNFLKDSEFIDNELEKCKKNTE